MSDWTSQVDGVGAVAESNGHCPGEIAALLDGDLDIETDADGIEVPEHFGIGIGDPGNAAPLTVGEVAELAGRGVGTEPSVAGMGSPCGSRSGKPSLASIREIIRSETACSRTSASSWTSSQPYPSS